MFERRARDLLQRFWKRNPTCPLWRSFAGFGKAGYQGGKPALYALVASVRPKEIKPLVRLEALPGEFSQHDFAEVEVAFVDESSRRIHFFASRLKYSRLIRVSGDAHPSCLSQLCSTALFLGEASAATFSFR